MQNRIAQLFACLVLESACAPVEPPHEVSWYLAHHEETMSKVKWCTDSEDRRATVDCQNALQAEARLSMGRQKDLAPLDWNAASAAY